MTQPEITHASTGRIDDDPLEGWPSQKKLDDANREKVKPDYERARFGGPRPWLPRPVLPEDASSDPTPEVDPASEQIRDEADSEVLDLISQPSNLAVGEGWAREGTPDGLAMIGLPGSPIDIMVDGESGENPSEAI